MEATRDAIGPHRFSRIAIGGGTPTFLEASDLDRLFSALAATFDARAASLPTSVEASPETVTAEKLAVLRRHGVSRLSLGVQSFLEPETKALGRPQKRAVVETALRLITDAGFETINLDLIFGTAGQTSESFLTSIDAALGWQPHEIFLYPLYVRALTGLARIGSGTRDQADKRLALYRAGRDRLLDRGYEQVSLRLFRRKDPHQRRHAAHHANTDGTLGLGCGARSETAALHYSSDYAVGRSSVRDIIADYLAKPQTSFGRAEFGVHLSDDDQRRRFLLLPLLASPGLSRAAYRDCFGADVLEDMPHLTTLAERELATLTTERIALTAAGYERADVIGPWLYSTDISARMRAYAWR
jgi:oxygen-independent coproporphyrinogen III oxidase